jgi:hypothetical protein
MHRLRGPAAVRLTLWALFTATLAMALVQPADAGTEAAPEIQDPANDQLIGGEVPACAPVAGCVTYSRIDIRTVWIDTETADTFNVNIILGGVPGAPTTHSSEWEFHATYGGTEVVATASSPGGGQAATPPVAGANVQAVAVVDNTLILTIAKSVYGTVAPGSPLTGLFVMGNAGPPGPLAGTVTLATDRAPNEGAGTDYVFGGSGGNQTCPNCTAEDIDGDGLNNTCEEEHFGSTNSTANSTGDPDGDNLTNGQECALGTDPTNADTDGDGVNDDEDPFPTDPARGGTTTSTGTTTSGTRTTTTSRSTTTGGGGTTTGGDGDGSVTDLDSAIQKLESDLGYLGMSAGGFLAVLLLCIVGLAVRWSL